MASKNLKGIAVQGRSGIPIYNVDGFMQATDELIAALNRNRKQLDAWKSFGTLTIASPYQRLGINAYLNNQHCIVPDELYKKLHRNQYEQFVVAPLSCTSCVSGCSSIWRIKGDENLMASRWSGETGSRPEYLGLCFGYSLGIADWAGICHLWNKCNLYGIDAMEVLASVGLLMELWQRRIINDRDINEWLGGSVKLEWGNIEAVEKILDTIAYQDTEMGEILKYGVFHAAKRIGELKGEPVQKYALYGKGGAAFVEEIRHTPSWATNFAVASRGCDHLKGMGTLDKAPFPEVSRYYFGTNEAAKTQSTKFKGASCAIQENRCAMFNSLGLCVFLLAHDPITFSADMFARAVTAVTGMGLRGEDLLLAGERTVNIEKAFNSLLGYRRKDDSLCHRWMKTPVEEGPGRGWKCEDYLEKTKDEYYLWHGWEKQTSLQTKNKLKELDLSDVADVLAQKEALA